MPQPTQKRTDYSGTPLPRKLGILSASIEPRTVTLLAAPEDFTRTLGELPAHVHLSTRLSAKTSLALCFVRSLADLEATVDRLGTQLAEGASAWIIHPKAVHKPGFNQNHVRDTALARGLVDYKVCSVNDDWSGLKFAWRTKKPSSLLPIGI